ncbi:MAG: sulfite exporter TauE/SafE family protein [Ruminococcaceae bacterium]|nr:sulfite exporter TauE/SafE family protein [Oscillospiraceae bacterium]
MIYGGDAVKQTAKHLIAGGCAGVLNGLFGAGGGLILVPLLAGWIGLEQKRAFATSVAIILPLSVVSYALFCLQGGNVWKEALPYLLGGIVGGLLSAKLFQRISTLWLHRLFGILILYGGVKAVLGL